MNHSSGSLSRPESRRWPLVLLLVTLFAILAAAQCMAQAPPAPTLPAAQGTASTAPAMDAADFLATLSTAPAGDLSGLTPSPRLASGCTSNANCGPGQLCCLACGYAGCERRACFTTKVCPHFP